jgi:hypothetical protein
VTGGFKIFIFLWENLSGLWCEGFKIVIILWKNLSGLWREDPRLSLFGGRISSDCGGRIQDCHYSVGESLRIVVGGFKTGISLSENLSGLWPEDPRLSLFGGKTPPNCGVMICCKIVIIL